MPVSGHTVKGCSAGRTLTVAHRARPSDHTPADVRLDRDGQPRFIEVNPLAGMRPGYSDLCFIAEFEGFSYSQLIEKFVDSFLTRHPELK